MVTFVLHFVKVCFGANTPAQNFSSMADFPRGVWGAGPPKKERSTKIAAAAFPINKLKKRDFFKDLYHNIIIIISFVVG